MSKLVTETDETGEKRISQAEFAGIVDVNRSTIHKAIKRGRLNLVDGLIRLIPEDSSREALETAALALWVGSGSGQPHHRARMEQIREEKTRRRSMENAETAVSESQNDPAVRADFDSLQLRLKKAETEKREEEARTAKNNRMEQEKELLHREAVNYGLRDHAARVREMFENLADRLSPMVHHLQTIEECHAVIAQYAEHCNHEVHASMVTAMKIATDEK